jgi:hypothetical protein
MEYINTFSKSQIIHLRVIASCLKKSLKARHTLGYTTLRKKTPVCPVRSPVCWLKSSKISYDDGTAFGTITDDGSSQTDTRLSAEQNRTEAIAAYMKHHPVFQTKPRLRF